MYTHKGFHIIIYVIQICSGISGRVLNEKFYAQRLQKLIYLHLFHEDFSSIVKANFSQN